MNKATSTIEINGNRYDTVTGQLVGAVKKAARHAIKPTKNLTIDGFTRQAARAGVYAKRSVHELKHRPQHSKTLMRSMVKNPARAKSEDKIQLHGLSPDHARADRARRVPKSSKVQRFGLLKFSRHSEAKTGEVIISSVSLSTRSAAATSATLPSIMSNASHHRLERLLDYALAHADAHKKELDKSTKSHRRLFGRLPKWLTVSLLVLGMATAIGFVAWHKLPQASLKLAAIKAHVNASLPTPISGYKIGPITASENAVITTVQSTSYSSKQYTVTEQASNQPAASLVASTASPSNTQQIQTVQDQDKTYVLSQDKNKNTAVCTKGSNTVSVEGTDLNISQLLEAAKNACKN